MGHASDIRIGISGWTYEPWRGVFYPDALAVAKELAYASKIFNAIEVNGTFYGLQKPHTFEKWAAQTPDDFIFTLKAPKYITHQRRLLDIEQAVANFFVSGVLKLGPKLGPILWQLPPNMVFKHDVIESFLKLLPHTTADIKPMGKACSDWMRPRAVTDGAEIPFRHAVEVRNESFETAEFTDLLAKHNVAVVVGDTAGRWPYFEDITSDFMYVRLHADEKKYPQGYTRPALQTWADKLTSWSTGVSGIYAFLDNDEKTTAPANAVALSELVKPATHDGAVGKAKRRGRTKD